MSNMSRPPQRPIKRLLVANRGEIATRILCSARELGIETHAIYVSGDASHAARADHVIALASPSTFMDIDSLIDIVKKHKIDAVHPGYGFLSESDVFAKRMWEEANAVVLGPGWGVLASTGDKLKARALAAECNVPVSPALHHPTNNAEEVLNFASKTGYPIMVKAIDGGGGRGIRLILDEASLPAAVKRAVEESPSKQVFAEKAAVDGFRHVEVQIIGDGKGGVTHLWERECSIQRRYQKIVELAPSVVTDRKLIGRVIGDALKMARHISYFSLGTFEFLVNPTTKEYYFLEINPRLQVEHTITESIASTDIVKAQLLLSQGADVSNCGLPRSARNPEVPPPTHSIQLRITAENVQSNWSLSIGKITSFQFPTGNGVRVDTHLINGHAAVVSADFDSLIAKLIITASSWEDVVRKSQRALADTTITGVKTNLDVLRAIVAHPDFLAGQCDTQWLETNQRELLATGLQITEQTTNRLSALGLETTGSSSGPSLTNVNTMFRKGDAWSLTLDTPNKKPGSGHKPLPHHIEITRVLRNEFPISISADVLFTSPASGSSARPQTTPYTITLTSTSSSAAAATSHHRHGNPADPSHVCIPFPGKLVEVLVDEGDVVKEGDVICVVQQMKMELEVRSPRSGRIGWVMEVEDGDEVAEGMLAVVVEGEREAKL
ncbi:uncharacterized protein EI97DRAFT_394010 [Westerdykella ornata]|uniref:Uncharacterized protein n=1 Tax=Westerdykella ornata TaxID=318751 RepID=A0A6A6JVJ1_WESOR|nr:uncharacterized protein EI97DRAFT_394010 [Westerdykella ornata]KAF2279069.1 hypothetical protein EI97DRAFT_394010 [Westerdykella ornata]